jgi:hypothetical protein
MAFSVHPQHPTVPRFGTLTPIQHGLELSETEASPNKPDKYVNDRRSVYNIKVEHGHGIIHHWHQWGSQRWPQEALIESDTFDLANPDHAAVERRRFQHHTEDMLDNLNISEPEKVRAIAWWMKAMSALAPLQPPHLITQSQLEREA